MATPTNAHFATALRFIEREAGSVQAPSRALAQLIADVAEVEREACAKVCEDTFVTAQDTEFDGGVDHARREFARRIRNR